MNHVWFYEEFNYLRFHYGIITIDKMKLDRTRSAILQVAHKMNLRSGLDHSPQQIEKMRQKIAKMLKYGFENCDNYNSYILGVLNGDGCLTNKKRFHLVCKDFDFIKKVEKYFINWLHIRPQIYKIYNKNTYNYKQGYHYELTLNSTRLYCFLYQFYNSKNKDALINLNKFLKTRKSQISYLEGFFDSEGCIRKCGKISIDNTSIKLLTFICKILKNNNIEYKIRRTQSKKTLSKMCWRITIERKKSKIKFSKLVHSSIRRKEDRLNILSN